MEKELLPNPEETIEEVVEETKEEILGDKKEEAETPAEDPKEEEEETNPVFKKIKEEFPDKEFKSDDDYIAALAEKTESLEKYKEEREKDIATIQNLFENNSDFLKATQTMAKENIPFMPALFKSVGIEEMEDIIKAVKEGEAGVKTLVDKQKEFQKQKEQHKEMLDKIIANKEKSIETLKDFQKEKNYSDEEIEDFKKFTEEIISPVLKGKFTKEMFEFFDRGRKYESDIKSTKEKTAAEVANKKLTEEELKKEKKNVLPNVKASEKAFKEEEPQNPAFEFFRTINEVAK